MFKVDIGQLYKFDFIKELFPLWTRSQLENNFYQLNCFCCFSFWSFIEVIPIPPCSNVDSYLRISLRKQQIRLKIFPHCFFSSLHFSYSFFTFVSHILEIGLKSVSIAFWSILKKHESRSLLINVIIWSSANTIYKTNSNLYFTIFIR